MTDKILLVGAHPSGIETPRRTHDHMSLQYCVVLLPFLQM